MCDQLNMYGGIRDFRPRVTRRARGPGPNSAGLTSDYILSVGSQSDPQGVGTIRSVREGRRSSQTGSGGGKHNMDSQELRDRADELRDKVATIEEAIDSLEDAANALESAESEAEEALDSADNVEAEV